MTNGAAPLPIALRNPANRVVRISVRGALADGIYADGHADPARRCRQGDAARRPQRHRLAARGAQCAERRLRRRGCTRARRCRLRRFKPACAPSRASRIAWRKSAARGNVLFVNDFKGHQRRLGRAGAGLLRRHFLDRRRQAEDRRHRLAARLLSAHPQSVSDRRGGRRIRRDARGTAVPHEITGTLDRRSPRRRAMQRFRRRAEPVVLLSPACASFDQYRNFEVRGDAFRRLVKALPGVARPGGR